MATHAHVTMRARRAAALHGIYAILNDDASTIATARAALDGGIRLLQYRAKRGIVSQRLRELRALARERGALLILNDDVDAAIAFDCDGVHLGPGDDGFDDPARARAALGDRLLGLSCGTAREARGANPGNVDYLGVGAVYATASKDDAGEPIGIDGLLRVAAVTPLPVAAIGGIGAQNVAAVRRSGVAMAAVISALAAAADPPAAARALVDAWGAS